MRNPSTVNKRIISILLVEDNPAHAELVMRSLENHRVANTIVHLPDGEAALDYLFRCGAYTDPEQSPRPHVILLDLRLPRVDGLDVLKEIKTSESLRAIPVVILTTSNTEEDVAQAYEYHANSYIIKPVDFSKFTQLMNELGYYWLDWNFPPPS
ncbi:MAG: response regulator [Rhodothermales bacterium]